MNKRPEGIENYLYTMSKEKDALNNQVLGLMEQHGTS